MGGMRNLGTNKSAEIYWNRKKNKFCCLLFFLLLVTNRHWHYFRLEPCYWYVCNVQHYKNNFQPYLNMSLTLDLSHLDIIFQGRIHYKFSIFKFDFVSVKTVNIESSREYYEIYENGVSSSSMQNIVFAGTTAT